MIFDTHSHLHFPDFDDIHREIALMDEHGVRYCTLVGSDLTSSVDAIGLAKKHNRFFATIGIHPEYADSIEDIRHAEAELRDLVRREGEHVVGIGEIGFDFYRIDGPEKEAIAIRQRELFLMQARIALEYNLPVIIHSRNAKSETIAGIEASGIQDFVVHCFSEDWEFAQSIIDRFPRAMIGFSGIVTFKNAKTVQEAAARLPLGRILLETDAPFLTPEPLRGKERNTAGYTRFVLDKLVQLRTEHDKEIERVIYENSLRFYHIGLGDPTDRDNGSVPQGAE